MWNSESALIDSKKVLASKQHSIADSADVALQGIIIKNIICKPASCFKA